MASRRAATGVRVRAFAKINLTLRVLATRADGYHEVRTVLQAIDLHDRLTLREVRGPFRIETDEPACPTDRSNLVWQAAARLWAALGRTGPPRNVHVRIAKRVPLEAGLGGGSSDAAAALRALAAIWHVKASDADLGRIASRIGADVPFFLEGGTALCVGRGDLVFPLPDWPLSWIVVAVPPFGVSARDAYAWLDHDLAARSLRRRRRVPSPPNGLSGPRGSWRLPLDDLRNDLEAPVLRRHAGLSRMLGALRHHGAAHAAMSGSGSAVFGLFEHRQRAMTAAGALARAGWRASLARTLTRRAYRAGTQPVPVSARIGDSSADATRRSLRARHLPPDESIA